MIKSNMSRLGGIAWGGKKIFLLSSLLMAAFVLSGCGSTSTTTKQVPLSMADATLIKSEDGGKTWNPKTRIDDRKTIAGINVLSLAINPLNSNEIYIGSEGNGLFMTKNGGNSWENVAFANKVYGLFFDPQNPDLIYASGVYNKRAKIYKRLEEGQEWKEIYTEPSDNTTISALAFDKNNSQIIYAGTSEGVILKTTDGGANWASLGKADGPIIGIVFDSADSSHVFFGVFQKGVMESKDGGKTIEDIAKKFSSGIGSLSLFTIVADPYLSGVVYVGTKEGIYRRSQDENWTEVKIIESSKAFPIRAIAINPGNSKEIFYSSAKAIYKSSDFGETWATFQLDTGKEISVLRYDDADSFKIYAGLRKF